MRSDSKSRWQPDSPVQTSRLGFGDRETMPTRKHNVREQMTKLHLTSFQIIDHHQVRWGSGLVKAVNVSTNVFAISSCLNVWRIYYRSSKFRTKIADTLAGIGKIVVQSVIMNMIKTTKCGRSEGFHLFICPCRERMEISCWVKQRRLVMFLKMIEFYWILAKMEAVTNKETI